MRDKLFLDTNVVIDLLGNRKPFFDSIAKIATLADKKKLDLAVSALSYSTIFYILSKYEGVDLVREKLHKLKIICETVDLTDKIIEKGLVSKFSDFEDALQYYSALNADCKVIITRNGNDFKVSEIPVMTAVEYLSSITLK
ncbi:PIN domain-containing protein [uncultured Draconibacterium sp.]|uniref:type II toxin-antitoxin system VapC family toxin n=1 Tax=uncultured Draconibacterium sp. TaxID=1573823 RepID=UPI0029C61665|nr:PIN domain-containing protein [uncultured Draconibacterium sp.]